MSRSYSFAKSLSAFAFAVLGLSVALDAFGALTCRNNTTGARSCTNNLACPAGWTKIATTCSTTTVGGSITYIGHHGIGIKCTWAAFQGSWDSEPGSSTVPTSVAHSVEGENNYATCGGWPIADVPPGEPTPAQFASAPYGSGLFTFSVRYQSAAALTCVEDPNAGIGNNCTKSDTQNPKHGGGGSTTPGASRACALNSPSGGTTLTYQFACADGVSVTGFLTLAPTVNGSAQTDPIGTVGSFTNCSPARIAAGACTMQLGGIPTKTVKVKGVNVTVVDSTACAAAFPAATIANAFNSGQTQSLDAKEILFYQEVASEGICDATTNLPTVPGLPNAAYGRYCQSDIGPFSDNPFSNRYTGDSTDPEVEGFDNELRVCPVNNNVYHTASQDVERVALGAGVTLEPQGTMNLNCTTGGNTDSGGYTVKIPDQAPLLAPDIDVMPLADAPTLEDISPTSATVIVDTDGVRKLSLRYPTCSPVPGQGLSANIINRYHPTNNSNVTLHLKGKTNGGGLGPVLFEGEFTVKVNGL